MENKDEMSVEEFNRMKENNVFVNWNKLYNLAYELKQEYKNL